MLREALATHRRGGTMGKVTAFREGHGEALWKGEFVAAVLDLCPDLNPDWADEASDAEFREELDPAEAARRWVARQGPRPEQHHGNRRRSWFPSGFDAT